MEQESWRAERCGAGVPPALRPGIAGETPAPQHSAEYRGRDARDTASGHALGGHVRCPPRKASVLFGPPLVEDRYDPGRK